jgi:predicted Zn-dependent protease
MHNKSTTNIIRIERLRNVFIFCFSFALIAGCATPNGQRQLSGPEDGVKVQSASNVRHMVPSRDLIIAAEKEYEKIRAVAEKQKKLAADDNPLLKKLKNILAKIQPHATLWNSEAVQWDWEVILIEDKQLNAFCMPGGKIAFFSGIVEELELNDDEIAMIMGHEMAHALREHARARIALAQLTDLGAEILSATLGLGKSEQRIIGFGRQLLGLRFSRKDENDADIVGLDLAARSGFDPNAGITLWKKMMKANKGGPPEWLSTHPSGDNRIEQMEKTLPQVQPLYEEAISHREQ